jgi:hypothetical protein
MSNAVSSQGTIIKRNGVAIAEMKDISGPAPSRKPLETTNHNDLDDSFVMGIRRHGEIVAQINFLPSGEASQDASTGLLNAWETKSKDGYEVDFPDGAFWLWSGYVQEIAPDMKVDGVLEAKVTFRTTGAVALS